VRMFDKIKENMKHDQQFKKGNLFFADKNKK